MNRTRAGVRKPNVAEGFAARVAGQVPMSASGRALRDALQPVTKQSWLAIGARMVRNALIAAVAMAIIPLAVVAVRGDNLARRLYSSDVGVRERMRVIAQPVRVFGVAHDPSIAPLDAGLALMFLQYRRSTSSDFVTIEPAMLPARPWRVNKLSPDMFATARPDLYDGPSSRFILEATVKGFSPREQAYLKALAEAPLWRKFDVVARASAVDIAGGQLEVPFGPDASPEQRPQPSYGDSRELAFAAVSRAAYYMSVGKPREAEEVLRSIISFGFAFIDNGTTTMDELIGTLIVGIGRDALLRFYVIENDPRADWKFLAMPPKGTFHRTSADILSGLTSDEIRRQLLAMLTDRAMTRSERFEAVTELSMLQCTSARGILFGQRADVRDAIERASRSFARYPSERAVVNLNSRLPSAERVSEVVGSPPSLLVSPAVVAGLVLHNPRMGACTLLLTSGR